MLDTISEKMPALDIMMIENLSRALHPTTELMSETEVNNIYLTRLFGSSVSVYIDPSRNKI